MTNRPRLTGLDVLLASLGVDHDTDECLDCPPHRPHGPRVCPVAGCRCPDDDE